MRVLVCGSRDWNNYGAIRREIRSLMPDVVIHGCADGADTIAEQVSKALQIDYMGFPAKWKKHGKSAGPIRNRHQFKVGKPDLVLAFHEDIEHSKGTRDMCIYAESQGCEVRIFKA